MRNEVTWLIDAEAPKSKHNSRWGYTRKMSAPTESELNQKVNAAVERAYLKARATGTPHVALLDRWHTVCAGEFNSFCCHLDKKFGGQS